MRWIYLLIALIVVNPTLSLRIPEFLIDCYRGNETEPFSPNTLQIFVDLLRKIENHFPNGLDMRQLSVKLFHDLRIDGIERAPGIEEDEFATPYSPIGLMAPKLEVLKQFILDIPGTLSYSQLLSKFELCQLHRLLSSTVDPFERKSEIKTCPKAALDEAYTTRRRVNPFVRETRIHQGRNRTTHILVPSLYSRCPIEGGVARTDDFGTISPGVIVASIAAGLQQKNVNVKNFLSEFGSFMVDPYENLETMEEGDNKKRIEKFIASLKTVDNRLAAGLISDLAEVVLYQVPQLRENSTVGFPGSWNDTFFPRVHFLNGNRGGSWEITDSEILTGIDGVFLSQQVASWTQKIRKMRLSQIFEMYYSSRGIPVTTIENTLMSSEFKERLKKKKYSNDIEEFLIEKSIHETKEKYFNAASNAKFRNAFQLDVKDKKLSKFSSADGISNACHRDKIFQLMNREELLEEVFNFVQILQFARHSVIISNESLKSYSAMVVEKFMEYTKNKLASMTKCSAITASSSRPAVDLTVIIDGSRTTYENLQIISRVAEIADVSHFGSNISVINGHTGLFMVNTTNSVANLFEQLRNYTGPYPTTLSLSRSLRTLQTYLVNQTETNKNRGLYGGLSNVVLIFSQTQRITEVDFESARRMIQDSFQQFPDLYFIFVTNSADTFMQIAGVNPDSHKSARFMQDVERYQFINANSIVPDTFEKALVEALVKVPRKIVSPFCRVHNDVLTWEEASKRHEFEEYLTPGEEIQYRIHPYYLKNTEEVRILFQGVEYGDFTVCMSRDKNFNSKDCRSVEGWAGSWFNISYPCYFEDDDNICKGLYFSVNMDSSNLKCSENDCRFPDQVRYLVRPEGLRCEFSSARIIHFNSFIVISSLLYLFSFKKLLF